MRTRNRLSLLRGSSPVQQTELQPASSLLASAAAAAAATRAPAHLPEPTDLSTCRADTGRSHNVLIGVGAGKGCLKLPELIERISLELSANVKLVLSRAAARYLDSQELSKRFPNILSIHLDHNNDQLLDDDHDDDDDTTPHQLLYIELRNWAHLFLVAPMDANTLSKVAHGQSDDLLTSVARCWDVTKPLVFSPSMDVCTYSNPLTLEHLTKLRLLGFHRIDCWEQLMSSPNYGHGFMAKPKTVVDKLAECLAQPVAGHSLSLSLKPDENNQLTTTTTTPLTIPPTTTRQHQFISNTTLPLQADNLLLPKPTSSAAPNHHKLQSLKSRLRSRHALDNAKSIRNLKAFESRMDVEASEPLGTADEQTYTASMNDILGNSIQQSHDDPSALLEQSMLTQDTILELFPRKFSSCPTNLPPVDGGRNSSSVAGEADDNSSTTGSTTGTNSNHSNLDLAALGLDASNLLTICLNREQSCYTCAICKNNYKNRKSMARHLKEQHIQGNIFHCKQCGVSYKRREKLLKHNRERHLCP